MDFQTRAMQATDKLDATSQHLTKSRQLLAETEELATETLTELGRQRDQIDRSYNTTKQTSAEVRAYA